MYKRVLVSTEISCTDLKSEIEAVTKDFMGRFASGDMKHLSEIYTEDCRFMPAGQDTIFGRQGKQSALFVSSKTLLKIYMLASKLSQHTLL